VGLREGVERTVAKPNRPFVLERLVSAQLEQALDRSRSGAAAELLAEPAGRLLDREPCVVYDAPLFGRRRS
jgi:hypothetical protein